MELLTISEDRVWTGRISLIDIRLQKRRHGRSKVAHVQVYPLFEKELRSASALRAPLVKLAS